MTMTADPRTSSPAGQLPRAAYERAERYLVWNAEGLIFRGDVEPNWLDGGARCWYRVATRDGAEFVLVETETGARRPAFDQVRLAAALSAASGKSLTHGRLPFEKVDFVDGGKAIAFDIDETRWRCDLESYACTQIERPAKSDTESRSPDGRWAAFVRDHNLWLRSTESGEERALTHDGAAGAEYGAPMKSILLDAGISKNQDTLKPAVIWSADSRHLLTHRLDTRTTAHYHLLQTVAPEDGGPRPRHFSYPYPLPGDEDVPVAHLFVADVEGGEARPLHVDPLLHTAYEGTPFNQRVRHRNLPAPRWYWWSEDGSRVYLLRQSRDSRSLSLWQVDPATGQGRQLIEEHGELPIGPFLSTVWHPNVRVFDGGQQVLWFSQRDGWGHLYLYDAATGQPTRQLTSGAWNVSDVFHVDEAGRWVYFTGMGREAGIDPYYSILYRVSLDGGEPEQLTPEDANHVVTVAPDGHTFVDTFSRVDLPPVTVLRSAGGTQLAELERADIGRLLDRGWQLPERFCVKARDGVTDLHGIIFRPSRFDPATTGPLPLLDYIYAGPQTAVVSKSFADFDKMPGARANFWQAQALAELGFAVVMIDGMGFPGRSKAFHDITYQQLEDASVADQVTAIRQLGDRYGYLDLDRIGIYGHSGGGYGSTRAMLEYPDFFKVAVASSGNHDQRVYHARWVERYQGVPVGPAQSNTTLAHRLKGKLLLVHGDMDENVHVVNTMVLVDALMKANKDFDLLIMPNRAHPLTNDPYFVRRRWDYFVRHLLGVEPPAGYQIAPPPASWSAQ